jgi:hypothetical protein
MRFSAAAYTEQQQALRHAETCGDVFRASAAGFILCPSSSGNRAMRARPRGARKVPFASGNLGGLEGVPIMVGAALNRSAFVGQALPFDLFLRGS